MAPPLASARRVSRDELIAFLTLRHRALLVTTRRDGGPQLSPVTCGLDPSGRIVIATYPQRAKVHNLRHDDRASLCVQSDDWNGEYVQVDGSGKVIELPDALEPLVEYYRSVSGEHPDWDEYRDAMQRQQKCLVRVAIERWGPISRGGFPPPLGSTR